MCTNVEAIAHYDGDEWYDLPAVRDLLTLGHTYVVEEIIPASGQFSFDRIFVTGVEGGFHPIRFRGILH